MNANPISVPNGLAGMVSEIICNILLAFRNESSFGVSFKKMGLNDIVIYSPIHAFALLVIN